MLLVDLERSLLIPSESMQAAREKNSPPPDATLEALGRIRLFDGIRPEGLAMLASIGHEETHRVGEYIFREGDPGGSLYLILEGAVRISREVGGMGEEALAVLRTGDAFGEMALIDATPRSADAKAHERCRLLVVTRDALEEVLFLRKDLAYEVLWNFVKILTARLRETNDKMAFLSASGRF